MLVDRFSAGLNELTRRQQKDAATVLAMLKAQGRFSIFEATANEGIGRTLRRLSSKKLVFIDDGVKTIYGVMMEYVGGEFPWTDVRVTEEGERFLKDRARHEWPST